jgi:hypothetical protein
MFCHNRIRFGQPKKIFKPEDQFCFFNFSFPRFSFFNSSTPQHLNISTSQLLNFSTSFECIAVAPIAFPGHILGFHQSRVAGFPKPTRKNSRMPSQGVSPISLDRQPAVAISHRKVFSRKPLPP